MSKNQPRSATRPRRDEAIPDQKWSYIRLGLDEEDMQLLLELERTEKLSKSDVVRRALRTYAKITSQASTPATL